MSGGDGVIDEKRAAVQLDDRPRGAWEAERDAEVLAAVRAHDEDALRALSSEPGGFGSNDARRAAW